MLHNFKADLSRDAGKDVAFFDENGVVRLAHGARNGGDVEGLDRAQIDEFDADAAFFHLAGDLFAEVNHPAMGNERDVIPFRDDAGFADGN